MLMKVHNKGQVVIPSQIRHLLHIKIGDYVDIHVGSRARKLKLGKPRKPKSLALAGVFSRYGAQRESFPSRDEMHDALARGLASEK